MQLPMVSIIVPCRNERDHIEAAAKSFLSQDYSGKFEVIVADGKSDDGTRALLESLAMADPRLRLIDNPRHIVSTGLNAAVVAARGEIIVRMDTHTIYAEDYVARCVETLLATGAENVGGPAGTRAHGYVQEANALAYHSPFAVGGARFHDRAYQGWVDTVTYGCWLKETLLKLGLFDEELVRNQDDELNLRLTRSGGRIWQTPSIKSWYFPRAKLDKLFQQYMQYGYWKVRVIQKHRLPASLRHLVPGGFVAALLLLGVLGIFSRLAAVAWIALVAAYTMANLAGTLSCCLPRPNWKYLPVMPFVFAAYHFGYGLGFLRGVVDFLVLKRGSGGDCSKLTR